MSERTIGIGSIVNILEGEHRNARGNVRTMGGGGIGVRLDGETELRTFEWANLRLIWTHEEDRARQTLVNAGWRLEPPPLPEPIRTCAWKGCDYTDEDNTNDGYGDMADFAVESMRGEEGHALVKRFFCYRHESPIADELVKLGFGSHRHGGINTLEDTDCPGHRDTDKCPVLHEDEMYELEETR